MTKNLTLLKISQTEPQRETDYLRIYYRDPRTETTVNTGRTVILEELSEDYPEKIIRELLFGEK